jgi:hypothetical protein
MPVDLSKKHGPLTTTGWIGVGAASLVAFFVYRRYKSDVAASAANASNALAGGTTIPAGEAQTSGATSSTPAWSSFAQWEQAALSAMVGSAPGYTASQALNDLTDWINGACVTTQGYTAIGNVISNPSIGLPPGFATSLPPLTVCASSTPPTTTTSTTTTTPTTTPTTTTVTQPTPQPVAPSSSPGPAPNLPSAIAAAMTNAGETLGGAPVWDPVYNEWLFFTKEGGIYNIAQNGSVGSVFNGSYEGLPAADKGPGPTGSTARTFTGLSVNPDGTYTLTDQWGENYTFTPTTPQTTKAA